jgi:hypothetical protein
LVDCVSNDVITADMKLNWTSEDPQIQTRIKMQNLGRRKKSKRHYFQPFNMQDIADATGYKLRTLYEYCRVNNVKTADLTLSQLVDLIISLRIKRIEHPYCPKHIDKEDAAF